MKTGNWYAVSTNPRCEDLISSVLDGNGFEVLLPKFKNSRNNRYEPLFPGYLFVRLDISLSDWVTIKYMHGVRKILSYGDTLIPVPRRIIDTLKRQSKNDNKYLIDALSLKEGDKVRFLKGAFEGLEGKYLGQISGKDRVKILLNAVESWAFKVDARTCEVSKVV